MSTTTPLRDSQAPRPAADTSFMWSDARILGFSPMDDTHEDFYRLAFRLLTCTSDNASAALDDFEEHAVDHFNQEEEWMRTTGFPPAECHVKEHATVLQSMGEVRKALSSGTADFELVHDFAVYLFQWFPGHADYLDSALAAWMTKRTYGGKPVVFRRKV